MPLRRYYIYFGLRLQRRRCYCALADDFLCRADAAIVFIRHTIAAITRCAMMPRGCAKRGRHDTIEYINTSVLRYARALLAMSHDERVTLFIWRAMMRY